MIICDLNKTEGSFSIVAKGHADYAPIGADIVCSAFSILIYSLLDYIESWNIKFYKKEIASGNIEIIFDAKSDVALNAFYFAFCGMKLLMSEYPNNIVVLGNFPRI